MENNKNILTREGLRELEAELKRLVEIERPQVIQEIKEAREQGDLSENAEFDAAREKQGQIEDRIAEIEEIINSSTIATSSKSGASKIRIGSKVTVYDTKTHDEGTYQIVGTLEADPFQGKISNISPLGKALINGKEGQTVTVSIEHKNKVEKFDVKIIEIEND